jgi:hypothetical protein
MKRTILTLTFATLAAIGGTAGASALSVPTGLKDAGYSVTPVTWYGYHYKPYYRGYGRHYGWRRGYHWKRYRYGYRPYGYGWYRHRYW